MVGLGAVSDARNREVVVGEQALGNRLVEVKPDFVVHSEHTVGRLCAAEQTRVVHILDTAVYLRIVENLAQAVNEACAHGTQIVALVGKVVHKQAVFDGAIIVSIDERCILVVGDGLVVVFLIIIVAHQCNPFFVRARRRLVLEYNAAEIVVVNIETVEFHIHVVLLEAVHLGCGQLGVICPAVGRAFHIHIGSRWGEVYAERCR